jgi:galactokinase
VRRSGDHVDIDDPRWGGYLANIPPDEFDTHYAPRLPERIEGRTFLAQYGGTTDRVTRIDPDRTYAVRVPAAHPVHEHARVRRFVDVLRSSSAGGRRNLGTAGLEFLGQLMYASHAAYTACGLGSPGTDLLVQLVRQRGPAGGLYGAKITGGGSGGTVAVLAAAGADESIQDVAAEYAARTGHQPYVFSGSSPGASTTGAVMV